MARKKGGKKLDVTMDELFDAVDDINNEGLLNDIIDIEDMDEKGAVKEIKEAVYDDGVCIIFSGDKLEDETFDVLKKIGVKVEEGDADDPDGAYDADKVEEAKEKAAKPKAKSKKKKGKGKKPQFKKANISREKTVVMAINELEGGTVDELAEKADEIYCKENSKEPNLKQSKLLVNRAVRYLEACGFIKLDGKNIELA